MGRGNSFIEGLIKVEIKTFNLEKFLNLTYKNGIKIWDIKKRDFITTEFNILAKDYRKIKKIAKITNSKIKIKQKRGLAFQLYRLNNRKIFIFGIILFIITLYYLSNLIWQIDIKGNKTISREKILNSLYKNGVKIGTKKNKTNLREVENNILKEIKELSLINLSIDGIKLNVDVVERTMPPSIFNSDEPVDIIAKKDGIITKLFCYKGTPLVKVGDYVQKGQVLISGDIIYTNKETNKQEVIKTVHSLGKVYAKVWYEVFQEQELKSQKRTRTGKFIKNEYIILNGNKIYIKKFENNFLNYDKIENKTKVSILGYNIPVDKIEETIYEVDVENVNYTIDQAIKIATQKAQEEMNKQIPKNVNLIDKKYDKIIEKNKVKVRLLYITEEEISYDQHR